MWRVPVTSVASWSSGMILALGARGCLLYTSDAADDHACVDLGGRRIIKKKKTLVMVSRSLSNSSASKINSPVCAS